ncbi:unnamed protein product [Penicillium salamii]|uniref:Hemolysin-III family protein n=1 Tax=Penicillium salamii TaxID=1612424 RepID=A0A9W4NZU0_9EURO|nr:unnamed protein product [Penicillium salamii]CAG8199327.1 unnamed protein product [Penicillium salamii]CAG8314121.1 unnamed protein product [Penicillium salamii]CAG8383563.1 unnamed protein product [Penicillium salamii]CAG8402764.1 unnamed protein product [Penicillium salamii]
MSSAPRFRVPPLQPPEMPQGRAIESISDTTSKAGTEERPSLLSFDEMPRCWSYIHNESVNIYSHLIPAIFFLLGDWYIQQYLASRYSGSTGADSIAFSIFMLTAVTSLSLSATYHTLMNHSQHVEHFCLRLDMLGIVIFILGDLVLGIYIIFWCESLLHTIYWSLIGAFGALTIFMTMHPKFQGSKHRLFRVLMFVVTGLCGVAPLIHGLIAFGMSQMMRKAFPSTLAKAGCLLSGILFYAVSPLILHTGGNLTLIPVALKTRFPESQYPGKFDLLGSHSIFHILVVCAAVVQLMGYLDAFDYAQVNLICSL